jgi:phosphoglycerate-specific signal transduction histidine kinase
MKMSVNYLIHDFEKLVGRMNRTKNINKYYTVGELFTSIQNLLIDIRLCNWCNLQNKIKTMNVLLDKVEDIE